MVLPQRFKYRVERKFLRVLIFAIFAIFQRSAKINSRKYKLLQKFSRKNLLQSKYSLL